MLPNKFNIRVYAIAIKNQKVLLVHENLRGFAFTKFPGGGVELGEGIFDALSREVSEELQTEVKSATHFYTTEFFQTSAFKQNEQIVSVYYLVDLKEYPASNFVTIEENHVLTFYWKEISSLQSDEVTFPIDKHVIRLIQAKKELF